MCIRDSTNAGGPHCLKYGVTRHYILGLEVVLADGSVARLGGRCHKDKTGFDLIGMFVGSEGLLGIVTEITCRIIPHPPARAMLSASFQSFADAAAAVQAVLGGGLLPAALEISESLLSTQPVTMSAQGSFPRGSPTSWSRLTGRRNQSILRFVQ